MSQDERRKACVEAVIDAIAAKQRAGLHRTFDEGAKAALRCIMRCYGYERYDIGSAQLMWIETYSTVSTQQQFMKAAWILLEYILIFPDRRAPDWEMRHAPNRVKAARCGIDGMKLDVLKLQREIRAWQEETSHPSMPTVDQNASLRNRIDKYVDSEPAMRRKLLSRAYPASILATLSVGDWPGRDEDGLDEDMWRSGFERAGFFSIPGWSEGGVWVKLCCFVAVFDCVWKYVYVNVRVVERRLGIGARVFDRFYVPTMDVLGSCDETAAWAFDYLQKPLGLDRFYDKLGTVAMRLQVSPTVNGVGEALSRLALRQFELDEDIEAYPCRLCNSGFLDEADLHEHVKEKHAASYANDPQRAFVEYRKKVLGLVMAGGPQAG